MSEKNLKGDKMHAGSLSIIEKLWQIEFVKKHVNKVPSKIQTYHLTLSTVLWSILVVLFGYLSTKNIAWLWGTSIAIILQYLTDIFDGEVGRFRNTGLIKWGYYMDHFLDYIFLCSILIGYSFIFNDRFNSLFFILAICGGFMVNSYLDFSVTNVLKVSYWRIGPTEIRFLFIIINTLIIFFHKTYLASFLPAVLLFCLVSLVVVIYKTQKKIWQIDMDLKNSTNKDADFK